MSGSTAVSLRGLTKTYGKGKPTVDAVDLDVAPGTLTALLGPSGCGKTTTLKMIAGLLDPDSGEIRFDDRDVVTLRAERRPVAMVFQKPLLFPHMTVGDNVGFGLLVRGRSRSERRRRVEELLALVRLEGLSGRRVGELSGGQEQRVSLARALVTEPQVLLLDEPLSQLDAALRIEMRDLIARIQRELGLTTIFVTHDQDEAVSLADHVALMFDGRIAQRDEPRGFYERPNSLAVARFFGAGNELVGRVRAETFDGPLGRMPAPGCPDGPARQILRPSAAYLVAAGGEARGPGVGPVVAQRFLGTRISVSVDIGAQVLIVDVPAHERWDLGQQVRVGLPPGAGIVLSDDQT